MELEKTLYLPLCDKQLSNRRWRASGYYHFVLAGADNVSTVGRHAMRSWAQLFQVSALLLALVELAGVVAGIVGLRRTVNRESLRAVNGKW
jgi:hypothetical protein